MKRFTLRRKSSFWELFCNNETTNISIHRDQTCENGIWDEVFIINDRHGNWVHETFELLLEAKSFAIEIEVARIK